MARALRPVLDPGYLTVVVNIGDDTQRYGVHVAADPDTVLYTLAGVVGAQGWGRADDTTEVMESLAHLGFDTSFTLGDKDFSMCLARTIMMSQGRLLSEVTANLAHNLGVGDVLLLPASNDEVRTFVEVKGGVWLDFQEYFVHRGHRDAVTALAYHGAATAVPAPGVIEAIESADTLIIAPSNPPLSIWPILAIDPIEEAVRAHPRRVGVSPLFSGAALKGPASEVMAGVGLPRGTEGVLEAYRGLLDHLFIDRRDAPDAAFGGSFDVAIHTADTVLSGPHDGAEFAAHLLRVVSS